MNLKCLMAVAGIVLSVLAAPAARADQSLHITFDPPDDLSGAGAYTHYVLNLSEGAGWRTGSRNGPPATEAQMRSVLSQITALKWTFIAFAEFSIDNFELSSSTAVLARDTFDSTLGGACGNGGWVLEGIGAAPCMPAGLPSGSLASGFFIPAFSAPAAYLGDKSAAYGGSIQFDLAVFVYADPLGKGEIMLTAVPEPETYVLMLAGIAVIAGVVRRRR